MENSLFLGAPKFRQIHSLIIMCLNTGTLKTINFPFGKSMILGDPIVKHFRIFCALSVTRCRSAFPCFIVVIPVAYILKGLYNICNSFWCTCLHGQKLTFHFIIKFSILYVQGKNITVHF